MKIFQAICFGIGWVVGKLFSLLVDLFKWVFRKIGEAIKNKNSESSVKYTNHSYDNSNNTDTVDQNEEFSIVEFFVDKYKEMETNGKQINWNIVEQTSKGDYPYPCATEDELEMMDNGKKPLKTGFVPAIVNALFTYGFDDGTGYYLVYPDKDKVDFWVGNITARATNGDRWCQALLVSASEKRNHSDLWCTTEESSLWNDLYRKNLIQDAENGDPEAMLAVADMKLGRMGNDRRERGPFYQAAGEAGLGDAYFLLAEEYRMAVYEEKGRPFAWGDDDCCGYYMMIAEAAKTNVGHTIGWCKNEIAELFVNGECGFIKNLDSAKLFYESALKCGYEKAAEGLKRLENTQ
ncbi:MAG: hypothetical protein E7529_01500 [Ruminococcaceae bacterium]|nr:hypothetical protein [Oscillospiraceae bacterium]